MEDPLLIEQRSIVASVALRGKVDSIGRVLRECTHETLQCLPHARRSAFGRVRRVRDVRRRVSSTSSHVQGILWASCVGKGDDVAGVGVYISWDRIGIAESHLRRVVDEKHVRNVAAWLVSTCESDTIRCKKSRKSNCQ
jgi:hypothetical protein